MSLVQLKIKGKQNEELSGNPEISFILKEYKRYLNYSTEQVKLYFNENVDFGKKITIEISRKADFLYKLYLCFSLPSLIPESGLYAAWTNSLGYAIIDYYELTIGDKVINREYGLFLEIWNELTARDRDYDPLVGKSSILEASLINAENDTDYCVPLKFWFCDNVGTALPIMSLMYDQIKLTIKLKSFEECVIYDGVNPPLPVKIYDSYLLTNYLYIDDTLRVKIRNQRKELLIEQLQIHSASLKDTNTFKIDLPFNHPIKELFWVFREQESIDNNDIFNFSQRNITPNAMINPIMKNCSFLIEGSEVQEMQNQNVYGLINTSNYHTNVSDKYIYIIPFSTFPEDQAQPSGSLNFSRIDTATLYGYLNLSADISITIFAKNYNWLIVDKGLSLIKYQS